MSGKKDTFNIRPFEKLRKTMDRRGAATAPPPPRQKKKEEFTEEELFSTAMNDVQVIEEFRTLACIQQKRKPGLESSQRDPEREALHMLGEITEGIRPMHLPHTQEFVQWTNPDYGTIITEHLHEGQFSVQDFLDLHGCSVPEAEAEVDSFLREAFQKGHQCIKIIHGRGLRSLQGPRIKDAVIRRLLGRYRKQIIAYASARQCDGALGALYVLLAKRKFFSK